MTYKYIKIFASCIPVKGKNQASICDLQRSVVQLIPNDLYDLLDDFEHKELAEIKRENDNQYDEIIDEYVEFLIKNEFAFYTDTPELFPDLDPNWDDPFEITNCILDISEDTNYNLIAVLNQLEDLNCCHIQLRLFQHNYNLVLTALKHLRKIEAIIHSVDIVTAFSNEELHLWRKAVQVFPRLNSVLLTNCKQGQLKKIAMLKEEKIIGIKNGFASVKQCGVVVRQNFAVNIPNFTESLHHNSCLNRKISIDVNGDIKNCPSMLESYGNIKDTTLEKALNKPGFKKYWNITKDDIEVCRDCEFRYICTDCRAYTERTTFNKKGLDLSKPLKCGYNPYTNEWAEWSTNPLKQKAIKYYGMEELVKENEA